MLKLTLATNTTWSADGFVYVNPAAIGSMARVRVEKSRAEHTLVSLLVAVGDDTASYPVVETPNEILALLALGK